ncbi:hypothetical protein BN2497_10053 [Janthinobacterium sp. CG23_2]|nr:hypothetical protein BN2497_10053 [Janthinobacterium sp. CG23_2]CUU31424.1 hypothetical protein BN3177_10053 [Janthinobacterium sp. CG23_2]
MLERVDHFTSLFLSCFRQHPCVIPSRRPRAGGGPSPMISRWQRRELGPPPARGRRSLS